MAASINEFPQGENPEKLNIAGHFVDAPAALHPGRPAIVGEPREVTYGELAALTNRVGNALRAQGVSRGDRVLIVLPDSAEFMAAFFGAAKIGAVAVPVNPFARSSDYIHYLENSEPRRACGIFAGLERAPATTDCHCRRGENRHARPVLREVERMDSGGQRRACGGEHFPSRSGIYALRLRQRRYAQSGGASPCGHVGHQQELCVRRAGSAS